MHAIVYKGPGELALDDRPVPVPDAGEVLVEVAHIGICGSDLLIWKGGLTRIKPPVVMGHEFCGTVVDPNGCAGVWEGQRVAVEPLINCGTCWACRHGEYHVCRSLRLIGADVDGAATHYVAVPSHRLHPLPEGLSMRAAALTEPTAVAVHMARRAGLGFGDRVLALGGGPIGALVAWVAKAAGAGDLVVTEPNAYRRDLLNRLGIETIDPTATEPSTLLDRTDGEGFDIVFELAGVEQTMLSATELARVRGTILLGGIPSKPLPTAVASAVIREQTLLGSRVYQSRDMDDALALLAAGHIPADEVITREVGLDEAIARAYEALRSNRDEMKILITPK
jgi:(R,R)-butanediol dehydrogenase / meso-butanediol dehydrogenase / diacetyl reductase